MEEVRIIDSSIKEDLDYINNNSKLKVSFENKYNEWHLEKEEESELITIRSEILIKKYKNYKKDIKLNKFSPEIKFTSEDLFEAYKTQIFSIRVIDNEVVAIAIGWDISFGKPPYYYISHVRGSKEHKGGCAKIIGKLLDYWWDDNKLEFKNNYYVNLNVLINNKPAIKCYSNFGFIDSKNVHKDSKYKNMDLMKELYLKKYLKLQKKSELPTFIKKLALDSFNRNKENVESISNTERYLLVKNINKYLNI